MPQRVVDGTTYNLVQQQKGSSAVYRSQNGATYLRIGKHDVIGIQLSAHRHLESLEFPVAKLIAEGESDGDRYFIESSIGNERFLETFERDTKETGSVRDVNFQALMRTTERFLSAQLHAHMKRDEPRFTTALHLQELKSELPEHAEHIQSRVDKASARLREYPYVLTHGDFNPANIYPDGVIDFEDTGAGPLGYDVACITSTTEWFPPAGDYEFIARYLFTDEQKTAFADHFDKLLSQADFPSFKSVVHEFEFLRAIWLTARMGKWPKMQRYRYDLLIRKFLE